MNIRNGIANLTEIFPAQGPASAAAAKSVGSGRDGTLADGTPADGTLAGDKAQLSATATQLAQSAGASDVRLDKVASIQRALEAGTYDVPTADVAQKIIGAMLSTDKQI
jgi:flagellar biosynthesis anti-sigma factor FlgM